MICWSGIKVNEKQELVKLFRHGWTRFPQVQVQLSLLGSTTSCLGSTTSCLYLNFGLPASIIRINTKIDVELSCLKKKKKLLFLPKYWRCTLKSMYGTCNMLRTVLLGTLVTQIAKVGMRGRAGLIGRELKGVLRKNERGV